MQDYVAQVAARRAVRVVLALEAWKLKHGSLPKTLDELSWLRPRLRDLDRSYRSIRTRASPFTISARA